MNSQKKITTALISVYHKENLEEIVKQLYALNITIYSTGGTKEYIEKLNIPVTSVEEITHYPSFLGGRVKTLHPALFGGILFRRKNTTDEKEINQLHIQPIDLVIVDVYPFQETVDAKKSEDDIIEKIDIGGISLIRAAAKNFEDVLVISSKTQYPFLLDLLHTKKGYTDLNDRKQSAGFAFHVSSSYDTHIYHYLNSSTPIFHQTSEEAHPLRYGENPHQKAIFYGRLNDVIDQLNGKELSYNNLVDIDAGIQLVQEFEEPTFVIIKHTNPCGVASAATLSEAYQKALQCDPISAFGGVLIANRPIDNLTATATHSLFFEVLVAPSFSAEALTLLGEKKNRILIQQKKKIESKKQFKSILGGVLEQDTDTSLISNYKFNIVTQKKPSEEQQKALLYINKIVKHTKSNAIVLGTYGQLFSIGVGQTSRIDALQQAIQKATQFKFDLHQAIMASDAFFPFPDCVEIASESGIQAIIQPGGSIKDQDSIDACNQHHIAMIFTGIRHFKH